MEIYRVNKVYPTELIVFPYKDVRVKSNKNNNLTDIEYSISKRMLAKGFKAVGNFISHTNFRRDDFIIIDTENNLYHIPNSQYENSISNYINSENEILQNN